LRRDCELSAVTSPTPPKLPHPSSTPRIQRTGSQERDRPIYRQWGGEELSYWEVEVTPLSGGTIRGRDVEGGRQKPRAIFEVRALFYGRGLPEFGSLPNTRLVPQIRIEEAELALAIARVLEAGLRKGVREIDIVAVAKDVERRRAN
jgi:hypothetical protein